MIVRGTVVRGQGLAGKMFGTPTANLALEAPLGIPAGVYIGRTSYKGTALPSIICYGADGLKKFEVHILNADLELMGETLAVEIGDKVSDLIPWESEEVMRKKIYDDIAKAQVLLGLND
ncbi:riboflavin kinase [Candidatus Uhrbacteria bacterium]|nr:riboflavin kinase [Candidatus Uhrbacteria bacterium]